MKKRILILSLLLVSMLTFLVACKKDDLLHNQKLSELRSDILTFEDDTYKVVAVTGLREEPFNIDGVSQKDKSYFTVITVIPAQFNPIAEYEFNVTIGGNEFAGKLTRHPFNQSYSVEIARRLDSSQLDIAIINGEVQAVVTAVSVKTDNYIDGNKAFSIAEKKLKDKVKGIDAGYEIFVRLIENPINTGGGYYWYVAYIFTDDTTLAVLIDPVTMEIIAVRD